MSGSGDMPVSDGLVPAVSVIMAVYNGERYLEEALRSIMAQTLREMEIIVVDDASTDRTVSILSRLAKQDTRLKFFSQAQNMGAGAARNRAISMARAPLIAVMDSDDIAVPNRLEVQKNWLDKHPATILLAGGIRKITFDRQFIRVSRRPRDSIATRWLARFNMPVDHTTVMFRYTECNGQPLLYNPALRVAQDYDLVSRLLDRGEVVVLPDILVEYRVHDKSLTGTRWRDQQRVCESVSLQRLSAELPSEIIDALAPFRHAYYGMEPVDPAKVFKGMRKMLQYDAQTFPDHRRWMKRQAAQLVAQAFRRSRMPTKDILRAFLGPGRDFLFALSFRYLEIKRLLPELLSSDPKVG